VDRIVGEASPEFSVNVSGCRGAGKTILLHKIGKKLIQEEKRVYYFNSSQLPEQLRIQMFLKGLPKSGQEEYVRVDETQANREDDIFVDLLESMEAHTVATIGAGISSNASTSYQFAQRYSTDELYIRI